MTEGVDFSRTPNVDWTWLANTLKAAGKTFVWRYAVDDKSPSGRGITAAEYRAYVAAGLDVGLYWESSEGWMLGGFAAGQAAARNAEANIASAGMPANTPVFFACDYDAAPGDQAAIDDCLRGAAAVMGLQRVGLYGGFWPCLRSKQNGTATYFCQTLAWSGGNLLAGVHLYQYSTYGNWIGGVDVDLVRAYQPNFGQANPPAVPPPPPQPQPAPLPQPDGPNYPVPTLPDWWQAEKKLGFPTNRHVGDALWVASRGKSTVIRDTEQRIVASPKGRAAGPPLKKGDVILRERILTAADGSQWVVLRAGGPGKEGARVLRADLQDAPGFPAPREPKKG